MFGACPPANSGQDTFFDYPDEYADEEQEPNLGYYPDGTPRTLTDEQIKIFRHTEIHMLRVQAAQSGETAELSKIDMLLDGSNHKSNQAEHTRVAEAITDQKEDGEVEAEAEDEEREYARFLEREQEDFKAAATAKARRLQQASNRADDRAISTRRRVRELDEAPSALNTLDYD